MPTDEKPGGPASCFPSIEKTYGQPIEHWLELVRNQQGMKHMEIVNWLKAERGLGHAHANAIVAFVAGDARTSCRAVGPRESVRQFRHPSTSTFAKMSNRIYLGTRWHLLAVALLVAGMAGPSAAQSSASGLAVGTRVRVVAAESGRLIGTVSGVRGDTLRVDADGREHTLSIPSIRSLQVSRGRPPRLNSALEGGLAGLLAGGAAGAAGAVLGHAVAGDGECDDGADLLCFNTGEWALVGFVVGAPVGAASGAVAGFVFPRERWRPVESAGTAPRLTVQSGTGGLQIGLSIPTS